MPLGFTLALFLTLCTMVLNYHDELHSLIINYTKVDILATSTISIWFALWISNYIPMNIYLLFGLILVFALSIQYVLLHYRLKGKQGLQNFQSTNQNFDINIIFPNKIGQVMYQVSSDCYLGTLEKDSKQQQVIFYSDEKMITGDSFILTDVNGNQIRGKRYIKDGEQNED